ncbi:internal scaffolding protein [Peromfec virus RodF7_15]|uniref:Internal scaffolding protein n=1 Tax=Peromfec virus RodF7_15 TaxID=2929350 RepID=A0A976R7C7_9VIRU|nr:internal scaffolding protein [Peromfec virus RodF7_15]
MINNLSFDQIYKKNKEKTKIKFSLPSMTQQQFKEQCDINNILARFLQTGDVSLLNTFEKINRYIDISEIPTTLEDSFDYIDYAQEKFMELDSSVRRKFGDNFRNLVTYLDSNPDIDSLYEHGLLTKKDYDKLSYDNYDFKQKLKNFVEQSDFITEIKDDVIKGFEKQANSKSDSDESSAVPF